MSIKFINCVIQESHDQDDSIYKISIPRILLGNMDNTELDELINLKVGFSEFKVQLGLSRNDTSMEMSKSLIKDLGLYNGLRCNAYFKDGRLCLGPVVGIFTQKNKIKRAKNQITTPTIYQYIEANKIAGCIMYFFCIDDIDFIKHRVIGTVYNQVESCWERRILPLPDVLYDRGGSGKKFLIVSDFIRSQLEKMNDLKKINPQSFFDKLYLHKVLSEYEDMKSHLPISKSYSKKKLKRLFKKNKTIYIKARLGSNGKSVMKVEKESAQLYKYSTAKDIIVSKTANSLDELIEGIKTFFGDSKLILQTEIDLLKIDDCIVDMRATLQRDSKGELGIITYVVRVGQLGSPVTSTASGSSVYPFEDFFKNIMNYSDDEILNTKRKIDKFLIKVYRYLEFYHGTFGEMGIDFGMDQYGKVWFIESNSKPAKTTIHMLGKDNVLLESYLNPLEYAKHIALL